jgi:hypothetical protein
MPQPLRPDPAEFERCVRSLCAKIETIVMRSGLPQAGCAELEGMLAAMPPRLRDHTRLMLNGVEVQAEYDLPTLAFAARYLLSLAQDIWQAAPHPVMHGAPTTRRPRRVSN